MWLLKIELKWIMTNALEMVVSEKVINSGLKNTEKVICPSVLSIAQEL